MCSAEYGFVQGRNELGGAVHLELIIGVYFILTSIAAKALIRIKLGRAGAGARSPDPYVAPGCYRTSPLQSEAIRHSH